MQIRRVESFVLKLEHEEAYLGARPDGSAVPAGYHVRPPWRSLYSSRFETLLVKVTAEDGTVGWGEGLAPVAPEVLAAIVDLLLGPALVGKSALAPRQTWQLVSGLMRERGHLVGHQADALAAVDIACWDLAGRLTGLPVHQLLGGAFRDRVETYVSGLPRPTDAERGQLAADWQAKGATAVKLHLGHGVDADLATVDAVREAAPEVKIAVDGHWAYRPAEARRLAAGLADRNCWFLEAPLAPEDETGHRDLARRVDLPVAVGETLRNRYEFGRWLELGAMGVAQPDVGRTGITEAMVIGELCSVHHVPVAPHHSVGLGVALAAGVQVSAAVQDLLVFEYQPTSTEVGQSIMGTPVQFSPDHFAVPQGPGLGVEVNEDAVRTLTEWNPS